MTSSLKSALPAHLKSALGNGDANAEFARKHHGKTQSHMAFENTSTSVAASQMRNALNNLADTVKDPEEKKVQI
jgi:UTP--glucose-1-phosphate uridylyltransferase